MPLRKITLQKLYPLARKDQRFFNALLKDPSRALAAKGMTLSPKDLKTLKQSLKKVYKISGKRLVKILVEGDRGKQIIIPWPGKRTPPWPSKIIPWPG
jgi:hypothetical protein